MGTTFRCTKCPLVARFATPSDYFRHARGHAKTCDGVLVSIWDRTAFDSRDLQQDAKNGKFAFCYGVLRNRAGTFAGRKFFGTTRQKSQLS